MDNRGLSYTSFFTIDDVNAKIAADAETMAYFDDYLQ